MDNYVMQIHRISIVAPDLDDLLPYNLVKANPIWMKDRQLETNCIVLLHIEGAGEPGEGLTCSLRAEESLEYGSARLSKKVREDLEKKSSNSETSKELTDHLYVMVPPHRVIEKVETQTINRITSDVITLSSEDYDYLEHTRGLAKWYRIVHLATGAVYCAPIGLFARNATAGFCGIRLNHYQRRLLQLQSPCRAAREFLIDCYGEDEEESIGGSAREEYRRACEKGYERLTISPCLEYKMVQREGWFRRFSNWLVGDSKILLRSARPYLADESKDLVRMTDVGLSQLGLDEGDKLIVGCGPRERTLRVYKAGSVKQMEATNKIDPSFELDLMIGIPAHIRREMGIQDLGFVVTVKRDTVFLFKKYIGPQVLTLIVFFFAVIQTAATVTQNKLILIILMLACAALLPVLSLVMFSSLRAKVK
jgi:hypothetical protein